MGEPSDRCSATKPHTPHWHGKKWCDGRTQRPKAS